jgi:hypothetical protein
MGRVFWIVLPVYASIACSTSRSVVQPTPQRSQTVVQPAPQRLERAGMPRCISSSGQHISDPERAAIADAEREYAKAIASIFQGQVPRLKRCYDNALSDDRNFKVTVKVQWTISPDGSVANICSVNDTKGVSLGFLGCLSSEIALIRFPTHSDQPLDVVFPLVFTFDE